MIPPSGIVPVAGEVIVILLWLILLLRLRRFVVAYVLGNRILGEYVIDFKSF